MVLTLLVGFLQCNAKLLDQFSGYSDAMQAESLRITAEWELKQAQAEREIYKEIYERYKRLRASHSVAMERYLKAEHDFKYTSAKIEEIAKLIEVLKSERDINLLKQNPSSENFGIKLAQGYALVWKNRYLYAQFKEKSESYLVSYRREMYNISRRLLLKNADTPINLLEAERLLDDAAHQLAATRSKIPHLKKVWETFEGEVKRIKATPRPE